VEPSISFSVGDTSMCHVGMQAGSGIAEILALEISRQENKSVDEARKTIWLMDSKVILIPYLHIFFQTCTVLVSQLDLYLQYLSYNCVCGHKAKSSKAFFLCLFLSVKLTFRAILLLLPLTFPNCSKVAFISSGTGHKGTV